MSATSRLDWLMAAAWRMVHLPSPSRWTSSTAYQAVWVRPREGGHVQLVTDADLATHNPEAETAREGIPHAATAGRPRAATDVRRADRDAETGTDGRQGVNRRCNA